jgi:hypothetical protein
MCFVFYLGGWGFAMIWYEFNQFNLHSRPFLVPSYFEMWLATLVSTYYWLSMHKLIVSSGWDVSREGGMNWLPTCATLQNIMQNILLIHHGSCFSQGRCHASWLMISTTISGIGCLSLVQHFFPTSCLCQQIVDWFVISSTLLLINVNNKSQLSSLFVTLLQVLPNSYPPSM